MWVINMNKATIESIVWHKDQLFKLLEDDDLVKIEGNIHSVKTDLNEIIEKMKTKKRVLVHRGGKTFYREQMVGSDKDKNLAKPNDSWVVNNMQERLLPEEVSISFKALCDAFDDTNLTPEEMKAITTSTKSDFVQSLRIVDTIVDKVIKNAGIPSSERLKSTLKMVTGWGGIAGGLVTFYDGTLGDLKRDLGLKK